MAKWYNNPYEDGVWDHNIDSFDTREEAIADGVEQYKEAVSGQDTELFDGCDQEDIPTVFYIGKENPWRPSIDTDFILEQLAEDAYWNCGDAAGDCINHVYASSCDEYKSLDKKLQDALNSWLEEQGFNFYGIVNTEKINVEDYL